MSSHELTFSTVLADKKRPETIQEVPEIGSPTFNKPGKKSRKQAESKMVPANSLKLNNNKEKSKKKGCC